MTAPVNARLNAVVASAGPAGMATARATATADACTGAGAHATLADTAPEARSRHRQQQHHDDTVRTTP